jgi:hypothetical protein
LKGFRGKILLAALGTLLVLGLAAPALASFPTTLTLGSSSACVPINQSFTLNAHLLNATNQAPLSGKIVIFQYALNASSFATLGNTSGYTTNAQGQASVSFTAKYNGTYVFRSVFGGTSDFFNPSNDFNGSISNRVVVFTSNSCTQTNGCGFLGFGCLGSAISDAFSGFLGSLSGVFGQISNAVSSIGTWLNPLTWLNALGLGWLWNGFLYFVNILLIFFDLVIAIIPYLGFVLLMINLFYVVKMDFEGLFNFWYSMFNTISVIADAVFNFVQILVDLVSSITGGAGGGVGAAAAAA